MKLPKNWKYKLLALITLTIGGVILWSFTAGGFAYWKSTIVTGYNETPPEQRRDSGWAEWWLRLAYFRGAICGYDEDAIKMYKEFLGMMPDEKKQDVFTTSKLKGMCSEDGKTGFGPLHPLAPDAFFDYLELYCP